ncbi:MAG: hypothetical protein PHC38_11825 [Weeksellaceae bacterium]|nr:hypothetical protein [Weeksellaceae bacterium]
MKTHKLIFEVFTTMVLGAFVITGCSSEPLQETLVETQMDNSFLRKEGIVLDNFAEKHILYSKQIIQLLNESETSFDNNSVSEIMMIETELELENYYESKGVSNPSLLVEYLMLVMENSESFLINNSLFMELTNEEQYFLIEDALNNKMDLDIDFWGYTTNARTCHDQFEIDQNRCMRNYAIGTAAAIASGFISFGWGTVIGYAVVQANMMACLHDSEVDYHDCIG